MLLLPLALIFSTPLTGVALPVSMLQVPPVATVVYVAPAMTAVTVAPASAVPLTTGVLSLVSAGEIMVATGGEIGRATCRAGAGRVVPAASSAVTRTLVRELAMMFSAQL